MGSALLVFKGTFKMNHLYTLWWTHFTVMHQKHSYVCNTSLCPRPQLCNVHKITLMHQAPLPLDAVQPETPLLDQQNEACGLLLDAGCLNF